MTRASFGRRLGQITMTGALLVLLAACSPTVGTQRVANAYFSNYNVTVWTASVSLAERRAARAKSLLLRCGNQPGVEDVIAELDQAVEGFSNQLTIGLATRQLSDGSIDNLLTIEEMVALSASEGFVMEALGKVADIASRCPEINSARPLSPAQWRDTFWDISSP